MSARRWAAVGVLAVVGFAAGGAPPTLIEAARGGDTAALRVLLQKGTSPAATEADGTTALHWAAYRGDVEATALLIQAGADVRAANRYGITPLWLACSTGQAPVIETLLAAGADASQTMAEGDTALMTAARSGSAAAVKALLAAGAPVNVAEPRKGQTALMWAAAGNHVEVVRRLLEAGADIHARSRIVPRPRGAQNNDVMHSVGFTPLLFAVRAGALDTVDVLLSAGAGANEALADGTSALVLAVISAHYDVAERLLDRGADANGAVQGWTTLHQVVWTRKNAIGMNNPGPVPRGTRDSLGLVEKLIATGADVNARVTKEPDVVNIGRHGMSHLGATPFLLAARNVDLPLMRALTAKGADPHLRTERGMTSLMAAAGLGIWAPGEIDATVADVAEAVTFCLRLGADVKAVDNKGNTALHGAAIWGSNAAVTALVAAGATVDAKNNDGLTAWNYADGVYLNNSVKQQPDTAKLLRQLMEERGLWKSEP